MSDIFISYASADRERAKLLSEALDRRGWSTWWDRTIPPGKEYDEVIEEALDCAKCVIVLWSHTSVASSWVKTEAAEAMRRKILVPALIDDVKIPLEFRRLQAADLSRWRGGEPAELKEFFQSIDLKIHGIGEAERDVKSDVLPSAPPPVVQRVRWTRTTWPAVALIVALAGVSSSLMFWLSQQSSNPGPTVAAQALTPIKSAPAVDLVVVDRPDPDKTPPAERSLGLVDRPPITNRRPPERDQVKVVDRSDPISRPPAGRDPDFVDRPPPTSHQPPAGGSGKVVDRSDLVSRPPTAPDLDLVKPPTPVGRAPVEAEPVSLPAVPESPTATARATTLADVAESPKQFEDILLLVTKDGETEEQDAILVFGDASLVVKDEDSNILRTLPYSAMKKAAYSRTQRRVVFVRVTRHFLTLTVGREQIVLQLPAEIYPSILSQIEKHTGLTIVN